MRRHPKSSARNIGVKIQMRNVAITAAVALGMLLVSAPAFAGAQTRVPEPVSLSLLVGGIAAIAAVKRLHRK
jgi:hypothetical protein